MDYQGSYFPEEHDERESKIYRTVKGIFKWTMYSISFLVYAIIIYTLIANRDSKIIEENHFDEVYEIENTESLELYRINTRIFMNDDGSLQLHSIDYCNDLDAIEIGVKFNSKKLTDGDRGDCLEYILYDSDGNVYPIAYKINDGQGRYGFARIIFDNVDFDLDSNDLRYPDALPTPRTETEYKLDIIRKSDQEVLFSFNLYNNNTTFSKTEYKD